MICPNCKTLNPAGNAVCFNCGSALPPSVSETSPQPPVQQTDISSPPTVINQDPEEVSAQQNMPSTVVETTKVSNVEPNPATTVINNPPPKKGSNLSMIMIVLTILLLLGIGGFTAFKLMSQQSSVNNVPTETPFPSLSPSPSPSPSASPSGSPSANITTTLDAYNFAIADNKVPDIATSKLNELDILYAKTSKQWTFDFRNGSAITSIKVDGAGNFTKTPSTDTINDKPAFWLTMPNPKDVASSTFVDQAKQKMVAANFKPSDLVSAKYTTCTTCSDYKEQWSIVIPLSGEENNSPMKAKQIVYKDGVYSAMTDATLIIY